MKKKLTLLFALVMTVCLTVSLAACSKSNKLSDLTNGLSTNLTAEEVTQSLTDAMTNIVTETGFSFTQKANFEIASGNIVQISNGKLLTVAKIHTCKIEQSLSINGLTGQLTVKMNVNMDGMDPKNLPTNPTDEPKYINKKINETLILKFAIVDGTNGLDVVLASKNKDGQDIKFQTSLESILALVGMADAGMPSSTTEMLLMISDMIDAQAVASAVGELQATLDDSTAFTRNGSKYTAILPTPNATTSDMEKMLIEAVEEASVIVDRTVIGASVKLKAITKEFDTFGKVSVLPAITMSMRLEKFGTTAVIVMPTTAQNITTFKAFAEAIPALDEFTSAAAGVMPKSNSQFLIK